MADREAEIDILRDQVRAAKRDLDYYTENGTRTVSHKIAYIKDGVCDT